jgi:hypothetical protein
MNQKADGVWLEQLEASIRAQVMTPSASPRLAMAPSPRDDVIASSDLSSPPPLTSSPRRAQMEELMRNGSSSITKKELDRKLAELRARLNEIGAAGGMSEVMAPPPRLVSRLISRLSTLISSLVSSRPLSSRLSSLVSHLISSLVSSLVFHLSSPSSHLSSRRASSQTGSAMFRCICCDRPLPTQEKWAKFEKNSTVAESHSHGSLGGPDQVMMPSSHLVPSRLIVVASSCHLIVSSHHGVIDAIVSPSSHLIISSCHR